MSDFATVLAIALGVFIAVVYPILYGYIKGQFPPTAGRLPAWVPKYAVLFVFSLVTALIVLALYRSQNPDTTITFWRALAMGFGWEASIEKILAPPKGSVPRSSHN
jgi:hypothetical protein